MGKVKEGPAEEASGQSSGWERGACMEFRGCVFKTGKQQGARPCTREQVGGTLAAAGGACGGQVRQVVGTS